MRPIDAYALITRLYEYTEEHTYILDDGDVIIPDLPPWVHIEIANFPTVEAIPIEWLEQFGVTRYQRNLISNIIGTWQEEQGDDNHTENNSSL